jgi:hypothetical protein
MKAQMNLRLIILSSIFLLLSFSVFSFSDGLPRIPKFDITSSLAPSTPAEATFEELTADYLPSAVHTSLVPVTPAEADFENAGVSLTGSDPVNLSPVTPAEANFDETGADFLAPATPAEAGFEEI